MTESRSSIDIGCFGWVGCIWIKCLLALKWNEFSWGSGSYREFLRLSTPLVLVSSEHVFLSWGSAAWRWILDQGKSQCHQKKNLQIFMFLQLYSGLTKASGSFTWIAFLYLDLWVISVGSANFCCSSRMHWQMTELDWELTELDQECILALRENWIGDPRSVMPDLWDSLIKQ